MQQNANPYLPSSVIDRWLASIDGYPPKERESSIISFGWYTVLAVRIDQARRSFLYRKGHRTSVAVLSARPHHTEQKRRKAVNFGLD
jgi:hypothetical protein